MDYRHLKTFLLICELGSINRVSTKTSFAQPALSRQLKMLEADLGVRLFIRQSNGMKLTRAGERFLKSIEGSFRELEQAYENERTGRRRDKQSVTLGFSPNLSAVLARRIVGRASATVPWVSLRILEEYARELVEGIKRADLDAAILHAPGTGGIAGLRDQLLAFEPLLLVTHPTQKPSAEELAIDGLRHLRLILPPRGHGIRELVDSAAKAAGVTLDLFLEISSLSSIKELVESGDGCAVLTQSSAFREMAEGRMAGTPISGQGLRRRVVIALPKSQSQSRGVRSILRLVNDEVSCLIASGEWRATLATDQR